MTDWATSAPASGSSSATGEKDKSKTKSTGPSTLEIVSSVGTGFFLFDLLKKSKPDMQKELLKGILYNGEQIDMKTLNGLSDENKTKIMSEILKNKPELEIQLEKAIGKGVQAAPLAQQGSQLRSRIGRLAVHGAAALGGGAAGYFGTNYAYDKFLKRQVEGDNTASPKIIKMKTGSMEIFYGYLMYLVRLQKNVAGISAELDTAFANAVDTLNDISEQAKKYDKGKR